jgi:uncharacterized membrane protein
MSLIILFLVGLLAIQIIPTLVPHPAGREAESLFLDEAYLIPMMLALKSYETILLLVASVFIVHIMEDKSRIKTLFNTVQITFAISVGVLVSTLIGGLLGAIIGALVFSVISSISVGLLISKIEHRPFMEGFRNDIWFKLTMTASALALGVCMQISITGHPEVFPLVAMGVVGFQMAYQRVRSVDALAPATVRV